MMVKYYELLQCRLTELKAEARKRREQREIDALMLVAETKRRREIIEKQFYEWNDGKKVDSALVYTALQTYANAYNSALLFSRPLDAADKDRGGLYVIDYMAVQLLFSCLLFDQELIPYHYSSCLVLHVVGPTSSKRPKAPLSQIGSG